MLPVVYGLTGRPALAAAALLTLVLSAVASVA